MALALLEAPVFERRPARKARQRQRGKNTKICLFLIVHRGGKENKTNARQDPLSRPGRPTKTHSKQSNRKGLGNPGRASPFVQRSRETQENASVSKRAAPLAIAAKPRFVNLRCLANDRGCQLNPSSAFFRLSFWRNFLRFLCWCQTGLFQGLGAPGSGCGKGLCGAESKDLLPG